MAHVLRLIVAAFCFWAGVAHATIPAVAGTEYALGSGVNDTGWKSSNDAACTAFIGLVNGTQTTYTYSYNSVTSTSCFYKVVVRATGAVQSANAAAAFRTRAATFCPANSVLSGSSCTCGSGYVELGGTSCVIDNGCTSVMGLTPPNSGACIGGNCQYGYKVASGEPATAQPYGRFCNSGCTVKGSLDFCGQYSSGVMISGKGICQVSGSFYTGDKCTGSGEVTGPSSQGTQGGTTTDPTTVKDEANPVPSRLPEGKCPGQVNGVDVVVNCGSTAGRDTSTSGGTTTNPDGSTTNNTTNNTTTRTTVCNAGSCTTTTNVTSGGSGPNGTGPGSTTTTTTETAPKAETCAKSPGSPACKGDDEDKPTGFGGSCVGGYKAVSEDAVLNAMAEEQYRRNCQVFDTASAESQTFAAEAAKVGDQTGALPGNFTQDLSGGADMSDSLGGGGCPADQAIPITVSGRNFSFVLALSRSCQGLEWLGVALVAATAIACAFIVFKD